MLSTGKLIFTILFAITFVIGMIWSYKKDAPSNKIHFGNTSKILLAIILTLCGIFLFVKMRH